MANISIPITINLPDDWKEQILERVKQDGDWVLVTRCEDCFWHQKCLYEQGLGFDGFCSKGEPKEETNNG